VVGNANRISDLRDDLLHLYDDICERLVSLLQHIDQSGMEFTTEKSSIGRREKLEEFGSLSRRIEEYYDYRQNEM